MKKYYKHHELPLLFSGKKPQRAKRAAENLWADDDFKALKKRKLEMSLKEQEVRVDWMAKKAALAVAQTELAKLQSEEIKKRSISISPEFK